jgi:hypothetical protein
MRDGYARLAELAEIELRVAESDAFDQLPQLWDERRRVVAELPPIPPAAARSALERAADLQGRTTAVLERKLAVTGAELRHLVRGRSAMQGYAPAAERVRLVDSAG